MLPPMRCRYVLCCQRDTIALAQTWNVGLVFTSALLAALTSAPTLQSLYPPPPSSFQSRVHPHGHCCVQVVLACHGHAGALAAP